LTVAVVRSKKLVAVGRDTIQKAEEEEYSPFEATTK
jgi:hypothetical protein